MTSMRDLRRLLSNERMTFNVVLRKDKGNSHLQHEGHPDKGREHSNEGVDHIGVEGVYAYHIPNAQCQRKIRCPETGKVMPS